MGKQQLAPRCATTTRNTPKPLPRNPPPRPQPPPPAGQLRGQGRQPVRRRRLRAERRRLRGGEVPGQHVAVGPRARGGRGIRRLLLVRLALGPVHLPLVQVGAPAGPAGGWGGAMCVLCTDGCYGGSARPGTHASCRPRGVISCSTSRHVTSLPTHEAGTLHHRFLAAWAHAAQGPGLDWCFCVQTARKGELRVDWCWPCALIAHWLLHAPATLLSSPRLNRHRRAAPAALPAPSRDPNLGETLEAYDGSPEYLRGLDLSKDELTKVGARC